jgi:hypothetical protein
MADEDVVRHGSGLPWFFGSPRVAIGVGDSHAFAVVAAFSFSTLDVDNNFPAKILHF